MNAISSIKKHYEGTGLVILDHKNVTGTTYALVTDKTDGYYQAFIVYQLDKNSGTIGGYIGKPLFELQRLDCAEDQALSAARAVFAAV